MYDLKGDHGVSKRELRTMLLSLMTPPYTLIGPDAERPDMTSDFVASVDSITNEAFETCDVENDGNLSFSEFKTWLQKSSSVLQILDDVRIKSSWELALRRHGGDSLRTRSSSSIAVKTERLRCSVCDFHMSFCPHCSCPMNATSCLKCGTVFEQEAVSFCLMCGGSLVTEKLQDYDHFDSGDIGGFVKTGKVYRKQIGNRFTGRFICLSESFLYYFKAEVDEVPHRVTFIDGCFVELPDEDDFSGRGFFGFEVVESEKNSYTYYVKSKEERRSWVQALRSTAKTVPITDVYTIGPSIGKGKFSVVHVGVHKETNCKYAIKILEKSRINQADTENLRAEVAILRVARHPRIIQMKDLYETQTNIHIVFQLYPHGDLFHAIKKQKSRLDEAEVKKLIYNITEAVNYLHSLGIVHRDLKPENLLVRNPNDITDIALSDFGLSKFATPVEEMRVACGTLSYVAPEVLRLKGYSYRVDVWSIGVIMYLLLSGSLPFSGKTQNETIQKTLQGHINLSSPAWSTVSPEAKDLQRLLLKGDPRQRPAAEEVLRHTWFST